MAIYGRLLDKIGLSSSKVTTFLVSLAIITIRVDVKRDVAQKTVKNIFLLLEFS